MPLEQLAWDGNSPSRQDPNIYAAPDGSDWQEITKQLQVTQEATIQLLNTQEAPPLTLLAGQSFIAGQPFYMAADKIWPSQANDLTHADVCGFTLDDATLNNETTCTTKGQVSRDDWTPVAGTEELTPGLSYYLHPTVAGMITETPPSLPGQYVVHLGKATAPKTLDLRIEQPIGL